MTAYHTRRKRAQKRRRSVRPVSYSDGWGKDRVDSIIDYRPMRLVKKPGPILYSRQAFKELTGVTKLRRRHGLLRRVMNALRFRARPSPFGPDVQ